MHFLATCTIGNKIVEILLSNGVHYRKQDILDQTCTIHLAGVHTMHRKIESDCDQNYKWGTRPLVSVIFTRRKMLTWARGVENVGKQTLSELMERFVPQVA